MRLIKNSRRRPRVAVYLLSSVQEEGGSSRGARIAASGISPHAAVAVDVVPSTDYPGTATDLSGNIKLGGGPTLSLSMTSNRKINEMITAAARSAKIPIQSSVEPVSTRTDGDAIASVGSGVATGVLSIPCRYVHSPAEVISMTDLEKVARVLAAFVMKMPAEPDFRPF